MATCLGGHTKLLKVSLHAHDATCVVVKRPGPACAIESALAAGSEVKLLFKLKINKKAVQLLDESARG